MKKFFVTFGQKYRDQPHPHYVKAHPDGYVLIWADCEEDARKLAFSLFGLYWAFLYTEDIFRPSRFPIGELDAFAAPKATEIA